MAGMSRRLAPATFALGLAFGALGVVLGGCVPGASDRADEEDARPGAPPAPAPVAAPSGTGAAADVERVPPSAGFAVAPLPSLAPVLERVTPAVVNVSVAAPTRANPLMDDPFYRRFAPRGAPPRDTPRSAGSGVVVDAAEGLVVTNDHVVGSGGDVLVTLADGRELEAERVGNDPEADVAVLRVDADELVDLDWADSDALRVGDFAVAIGNPFGLGQTVTSGIVSALGRSGLGIEEFEDFIQTDASINPGNSGGALVGLDGRLIGINTAIVGPAGGNVGIGFAIPANLARDIVEQLVETGEVRRGALGIEAQALTDELARALDVEADRGVVVARVRDGSPAEEAGLAPGDVIVAIDGRPVADVGDVRNRIGLVRLGQRLALSVVRDGEPTELEATVARLQLANELLDGARFVDALSRGGRPYVAVEALEPDSPLARAGLAPGDVVLSLGGTRIGTARELEALSERYPDELVLEVQRGRSIRRVRVG